MRAENRPDLRCERVRLLLSIAFDDAATAAQQTEIDEHLPTCTGCGAARAADRAVRDRIAVPAGVPEGFAERITAGVSRLRIEARAQNRFLVGAAVAAVLVAGVALFTAEGGPITERQGPGLPVADGSPREIAGNALRAGLAFGRVPRLGTEDR